MTDKRYCRTCDWGRRNDKGFTDLCVRKVVEDKVEGPQIVSLSCKNERSVIAGIMGGCSPDGKFWKERNAHRSSWALDERLIP